MYIIDRTHTKFKTDLGFECGVGVARSTLNTPWKQRARGGNKRYVKEAGEGLYARRRFKKGEVILDYAYMNGKQGEKVDHLTREERWQRYPASLGIPDGTGQYLLDPPFRSPAESKYSGYNSVTVKNEVEERYLCHLWCYWVVNGVWLAKD